MITLPKTDGYRLLREKIQERLPSRKTFTLREAVDALEEVATTHCVEETDGSLLYLVRKRRHARPRTIVVALAWQMIPKEEFFEASQIYIELTIPGGLWQSFYSDESFTSEQFEEPQVANFFGWVRYLLHFRWLGDRRPLEAKVELKETGPEEFFEMARKFIPMLIEKGLWRCDGPSCPIEHEAAQGMANT